VTHYEALALAEYEPPDIEPIVEEGPDADEEQENLQVYASVWKMLLMEQLHYHCCRILPSCLCGGDDPSSTACSNASLMRLHLYDGSSSFRLACSLAFVAHLLFLRFSTGRECPLYFLDALLAFGVCSLFVRCMLHGCQNRELSHRVGCNCVTGMVAATSLAVTALTQLDSTYDCRDDASAIGSILPIIIVLIPLQLVFVPERRHQIWIVFGCPAVPLLLVLFHSSSAIPGTSNLAWAGAFLIGIGLKLIIEAVWAAVLTFTRRQLKNDKYQRERMDQLAGEKQRLEFERRVALRLLHKQIRINTGRMQRPQRALGALLGDVRLSSSSSSGQPSSRRTTPPLSIEPTSNPNSNGTANSNGTPSSNPQSASSNASVPALVRVYTSSSSETCPQEAQRASP